MQFGFKTIKPECLFGLEVVGEGAHHVSDNGLDRVGLALVITHLATVAVSNYLR